MSRIEVGEGYWYNIYTSVNAMTLELYTAMHTHSNQTILDNTTASFTTAKSTAIAANTTAAAANTSQLSGYPANCKVITGTTGAVNTTTNFQTGLSKSQIVGFLVQVSDSTANWLPPCYGTAGTDSNYYKAFIETAGALSINVLTESTDVQYCALVAIIFYTD